MKKSSSFLLILSLCLTALSAFALPVFADEEVVENLVEPEVTSEENSTEVVMVGTAEECLALGDVVDYGVLQAKGRTYTKELTVSNSCYGSFGFTAEILPYENDNLANKYKEASNWLALMGGVSTFYAKSEATTNVNTRVTLPLEVEGGTYYANLHIKSEDGTLDSTVMVRMDVQDENFKYGGEIKKSDFKIFNFDGTLNGTVVIENSGTAGYTAKVKASYAPLFGGEGEVFYEESMENAPGETLDLNYITTSEKLGDLNGVYKATYEIEYVNSEGRLISFKTSRTVVAITQKTLFIICGALAGLVVIVVVLKVVFGAVKRKKTDKKYKDIDNEL